MNRWAREGEPRLVLASGSPRRRQLLESLGLEPWVRPVDYDETPWPAEKAPDHARRLAIGKARVDCRRAEVVIGADTIVVLETRILGKPRDPDHAASMLRALAGRQHTVLTGVAVCWGGGRVSLSAVQSTRVRLTAMTDDDIDWYVSTGEVSDKAGAYAAQGLGALFVDSIDGNYTNVVGLPLTTLSRLLRVAGVDLRRHRSDAPVG